jgi:predicted DNA-binding protein with PD1-like motif
MTEYKIKRTLVGQIQHGADLYTAITRIATESNITTGRVSGIGAVKKAKVAFYDQTGMKYADVEINKPMEILSLKGNITLKDGKPFLHAHVVLSDEQGHAHGGHLLPDGSPVFACEITIDEFDGPAIERGFDSNTGLTLWPQHTIL